MRIQNSKFKMQNYNSKFKILLRVFLLCLTFNFSLLTFHFEKASAASLSLSLDPSIIEIHARPPSVATSTLSIQNKSDNLVQLQIQIRPFKAKFENGELEFLNSQNSFLVKNIQILDGGVSVEGIALGPRQQKDLTLNVNIPQDTNVSDYYFSIVLVSQSTTTPTSTSSSNQLGIASNVLLSVGAKEIPDGVIEEFSAGLFYESGPVPFTLRVKNKGTHFIKPKGEILIKNMFGQNIGRLDLVSVNVLSDSIRAIPNASNLDFQSPKALWKENFLLGFYTATLNLALSDEGPNFTKSISFFAFPFQGLIVIVIVLIGTIIVVSRVRARMSRRDDEKSRMPV